MKSQTEHQIQAALIRDIMRVYPWAMPLSFGETHTKNNRILNARLGYLKGTADIFISDPATDYNGMYYHGMYLEVKKDGEMPTPEQEDFLLIQDERGYYATWKAGFTECWQVVCWYLKHTKKWYTSRLGHLPNGRVWMIGEANERKARAKMNARRRQK